MTTEKRLIDANEAIRHLRGACVAKYPNTFMMGLFASADEIAKLPTVDAVEVVHGYNTEKARWFQCSVCGYGFDDIFLLDESDEMMEPNYCAHCGAKMDGDGNG